MPQPHAWWLVVTPCVQITVGVEQMKNIVKLEDCITWDLVPARINATTTVPQPSNRSIHEVRTNRRHFSSGRPFSAIIPLGRFHILRLGFFRSISKDCLLNGFTNKLLTKACRSRFQRKGGIHATNIAICHMHRPIVTIETPQRYYAHQTLRWSDSSRIHQEKTQRCITNRMAPSGYLYDSPLGKVPLLLSTAIE